jgi:aminoglycoside phosphotransferase (APT) family kinase protein
VTDRVPERFRGDVLRRIGHGGEATVYELTGGRVLRVHHGHSPDMSAAAAFYDELAAAHPRFGVPRVLEHADADGVSYSLHTMVPGRALIDVLPELSGERRARALDAYVDAAHAIGKSAVSRPYYGEVLPHTDGSAVRADTWPSYLRAAVDRQLIRMRAELEQDVPSLDRALEDLGRRIDALPALPSKTLVHGDYFPGNVIVDDDLRVTGIIDFWPAIGDPAMDVASAAIFLEVLRNFDPADATYVMQRLVDRHGESFREVAATYRLWYAIHFAHCKFEDDRLYAWCTASLRNAAV